MEGDVSEDTFTLFLHHLYGRKMEVADITGVSTLAEMSSIARQFGHLELENEVKERLRVLPYTFTELEDNEAIKAEFLGYTEGLMQSNPGDWILQPATTALVPAYRSMEVRDSDVWIVTYPKVGPD